MISLSRLEPFLLASAVAITRWVFRSHYLYDLDSVNFALAINRFDPRVHQPHPPGYFLYVCLGRLLNAVLHDANLSLVVLSIAASCAVVVLIFQIAVDWFEPAAARFAGLLFLFSPLAWFHGTVALTYSVEAFFSALLGYLCWRIDGGRGAWAVSTGILLGISAGVRPSSLLFLGPLFLYALRNQRWKQKLGGGAALAFTMGAWFLPMIWISGGFNNYFGALFSLWKLVPSNSTVFNSSPATSIARACTIAFIYLLSFGAAAVVPLRALRRPMPADSRKKTFTMVWMAPALCFFTFIFLKFVNSGYLLLLSAPACIWLGSWMSEWYRNGAWKESSKLALMGLGAAANVLIFLASPLYCSYRSVRHFEAELAAVRAAILKLEPASDTLIVGFDSHFLGYRHAGYYLPGYVTVEYPEVRLLEGNRIFTMHNGDTHLVAGLPFGGYSRFVLFPLPAGDAAFAQYMHQVETLLPGEALGSVRVGDHDFVTGPIADLPRLFPNAAAASASGVYLSMHSAAPPVNSREHQPPGAAP